MNHEKGKLLKTEKKFGIKIPHSEYYAVRVEDEFEAICKTCHQIDPKTKLTTVTYEYA